MWLKTAGVCCFHLRDARICWFFWWFFLEDQLPPGFPTIDMGPQLKVVERSRTATMLCAASGNPDPEITWFKDFLPVNTSSNNGRIKQLRSGNRSSLQSFPFQYTFTLYRNAFSSLQCQLPLQRLLFLILAHPFSFLIAVPLSSCHGYFSAAAVIWVGCAANSSRP